MVPNSSTILSLVRHNEQTADHFQKATRQRSPHGCSNCAILLGHVHMDTGVHDDPVASWLLPRIAPEAPRITHL